MKVIVAPTDFSPASKNAVNYAADLALQLGMNISVLHVCQIPVAYNEIPSPSYTIEELLSDANRKMDALKTELKEKVQGRIKIHTEVVLGNTILEIKKHSSALHPYVLVMGAEKKGGLERFLVGGTTVTAVRQLPWPILVVPETAAFHPYKKIGLACDFQNLVKRIPIDEIKDLIKKSHAELHVLHVSPDKGRRTRASSVTGARWLSTKLAELKPVYDFVHGEDAGSTIDKFAVDSKLDLLMIIPKKRGLLTKLFVPSRSRKIVLNTHVPVMSIHE